MTIEIPRAAAAALAPYWPTQDEDAYIREALNQLQLSAMTNLTAEQATRTAQEATDLAAQFKEDFPQEPDLVAEATLAALSETSSALGQDNNRHTTVAAALNRIAVAITICKRSLIGAHAELSIPDSATAFADRANQIRNEFDQAVREENAVIQGA